MYVPVLLGVFDTEALGPVELATVLVASTVVFGAVEAQKWILRRR